MEKTKRTKTQKLYILCRILVVLLLLTSTISIFLSHDISDSSKSRNVFVATQSFLLLISSFVPSYLEKKWNVDIPNFLEIIFLLFCICAMFLGEICEFYKKVFWWDSMLHTLSGGLLAILGFSIIRILNNRESKDFNLSPIFECVFVVCFSVMLGVVWEIVEYAADGITGSNMQRYMDNYDSSIIFSGRRALADTMKDLILDVIGATAVSTLGYFDLSLKKGWINKWLFRINSKNNIENSEEN